MMRFSDCILFFASNYSPRLDVLFGWVHKVLITDLAVCNEPHFGNYCDYVQKTNKLNYNYLDGNQLIDYSMNNYPIGITPPNIFSCIIMYYNYDNLLQHEI